MFWRSIQLILFWALLLRAEAAIRVALDRDTVMAGESVGLKIICEGGQPDSVPRLPEIPNLSIRYQNATQQFSNINGQQSFTVVLNYHVTARAEGEFNIPSLQIEVNGQTHQTDPVKLRVTKASAEAGNREAFAKLIIPRTNIYVGEVFPIEIQLFVTQAEQLQLPTLKSDGFIVQKQAPYTKAQTQIGNTLYTVLSFKSSVSAAKAGDLTLGPGEMNFNLLTRQGNNDPFAEFFGRFSRRPVTVLTETHTMRVSPLPSTNVPEGFSGAIGSFAMNVEASPVAVTAGDPITLKITLSGNGNLDSVQLPNFKWPGFRFYDPAAEVISNDPLGFQGTKKFEQVIVPETADIKAIPEIIFSFFDPIHHKYRSLSRSAIALQVRPGAQTTAPQATPGATASTAPQPQNPARDIVHIKTDAGGVVAWNSASFTSPWFLALQSIPLLGFFAALAWRKKQDRLANNPRLRRRIETEKFIKTSLHELENFAARQETERFYELLFRVLQEQLGERIDLPSSSITEAVLDRELPKLKAEPALVSELHLLFQECNQARYAPGRLAGHLQTLTGRAREAVAKLQLLRP